MDLSAGLLALAAIGFGAAFVNGALGYGFSSLTVPLALMFFAGRVLNPALVLVEVAMNVYALAINADALRAVWKRVLPILLGLFPGVAAGSYLLVVLDPEWLKLGTYAMLLPLILAQAAGLRRPLQAEKVAGVPVGAALGVLYALTTISGPPLALFFNNQGLAKREFRAGLALVRAVESGLTALAYWHLGLFTAQSLALAPWLAPAVLLGLPLGAYAIARADALTFRRVCLSFDLWVVGFGLSRVLAALGLAGNAAAYAPLAVAALIDLRLLSTFFRARRTALAPA